MLYGCSSLSDIKSLENWNVSHSNNFNGMFYGCSSLSNIKSLENWNVSNSIFDSMFNNPSINSNNIDNEIKNKNYINRKYKKNKLLTNYEKMKKPFVPIKKSKSNFNKIYPDLFLTPLKDDSKKDNEKTETKNLVANTPLLNNNRLYGLYRKFRSGNTKVSSNNNIISNNKSFEENCPSKANNNGLNTTKIIQFKERGNPNKIALRKYNNAISEDFRFSTGKKKIKNLNIDDNLLNSVNYNDTFNRVNHAYFKYRNDNFIHTIYE
jgi:surface protein